MAVLTRSEIIDACKNADLVECCVKENVRGCSYDLTVGTIFWDGRILRGDEARINIPPGGIVGLFTKESLNLPDNMYGTAFAINKQSSRGFLVVNPGHIDPGFRGALTVKAINLSKNKIVIQAGDPIFTVIFNRLAEDAPSYKNNSPENRILEFNRDTVEKTPRSIGDLVSHDKDGPFPSRSEVRKIFWTQMGGLAAALTLLFAGVAALPIVIRHFSQPAALNTETPSTTTAVDGKSKHEDSQLEKP